MKKRMKLRACCAALAAAVCCSLVPGLSGQDALAVSQSQIDALEEQRDELKAQREEMQAGIDELESQQADILEQKTALDERNEVYRQEIELTEEQVGLYTQLVEQKQREVEQATADEDEQLANYRRHVRAMEENGKFTYLSILFGSSSLGELMSNLDMVGEIMEADQRSYEQYTAAREESERVQAEYAIRISILDARQAELEAEKAELEAQIEEAEQLIAELEAQLETDRAAYEEQLAKEQALESEIQNMIAELERQEAANSIVLHRHLHLAAARLQPRQRLRLAYPPIWGDMRFHAGEDIGAPSGTPILAADSGIATVHTQHGNGYGNYIIINHGGGRTTLYRAHERLRRLQRAERHAGPDHRLRRLHRNSTGRTCTSRSASTALRPTPRATSASDKGLPPPAKRPWRRGPALRSAHSKAPVCGLGLYCAFAAREQFGEGGAGPP